MGEMLRVVGMSFEPVQRVVPVVVSLISAGFDGAVLSMVAMMLSVEGSCL